jgi:uncharacterized integral membrane protein
MRLRPWWGGYVTFMTDSQRPPASDPSTRPSEAQSTPAAAPAKRSFSVGQFLAGALFVLVVVFIFENTEKVRIRFIAGPKVSAPIWTALLAAAVVGGLISMLLRWRRQHHSKQNAKGANAKH